MTNKSNYSGFTLLELLISIAILGILSGVAVPLFSDNAEKRKLVSESEKIQRYLTYARSEAVKNNTNITISYSTGASWCVGLSDSGACDCTTANSCTITSNGEVIEKTINNASNASFALTVDNALLNANFDPQRGMLEKNNAPSNGELSLTASPLSTTISVNVLGRADICSDTLGSYSNC